MSVPKGFKQTEVGVIPEDWEVAPLGELTEKVGSGITPTGGQRIYKTEGRVFMRSQNVGWGSLLLDDVAFIDDATHASFSNTEIQLNDVFLNITGASIGRSAIADSRVVSGNVSQHVCIIRACKKKLAPRFLNYFLLSAIGQKQIDTFQVGGNRQGLNFGQIRSIYISKPKDIKEQTAIAAALSDMDALIEGVEKLLEKKRRIKQGAMQELLTGKRRASGFASQAGFQQTEVGVIPEDWIYINIESLVEKFVNGGTPSTKKSEYWKGNIPWITGADILNQKISTIRRYITNEAVQNSSTNVIKKGKLLFVSRTGVGKMAIANFDVAISQDITGIYNIPELLDIFYLFWFLNFTQKELLTQNQGTSIQGITRSTLSSIKIPLPPTRAEQTAIASILSDMDSEIEQLEIQLAKYRQLKTGMMQELLTGKKRLT